MCRTRAKYFVVMMMGGDGDQGKKETSDLPEKETRLELGFGKISQLFPAFHYSLLDFQIFSYFFCLIPLLFCFFTFPLE